MKNPNISTEYWYIYNFIHRRLLPRKIRFLLSRCHGGENLLINRCLRAWQQILSLFLLSHCYHACNIYIINQLNPGCDNVTTEYQTLWRERGKRVLCDTASVGELCRCLSTGSPFGHHPRLRMVRPRWGRWMHTGKLSFLNLPPPRVHPSSILTGDDG